MQASKKILITVTGILLALFVSSLMVLRSDVHSVFDSNSSGILMSSIPIEPFKTIHISGNWKVQIKQGRAYKAEVAVDRTSQYLPQFENRNDTLFLTIQGDSLALVSANIVAPYMNSLVAENGVSVKLKSFELDSMTMVLDDSHLIGDENKLTYTSYVTTGNSKLEFLDDPMK